MFWHFMDGEIVDLGGYWKGSQQAENVCWGVSDHLEPPGFTFLQHAVSIKTEVKITTRQHLFPKNYTNRPKQPKKHRLKPSDSAPELT